MASAWGLSWAKPWGNSWGVIVTGGGGLGKQRKVRGWANERAAQEASLRPIAEPVVTVVAKPKKPEPVYTFEPIEGLKQELEQIRTELELKKVSAEARLMAKQEYDAFVEEENEAIEALMALISYEESLIGIPMGLQSSRILEV